MHRKGIIVYSAAGSCQHAKILDTCGGIVGGFIARQDLFIGACVEYTVKKKGSRIFFDEIDIVALPTVSTVDNLLLLHQSLEICLYCMPDGSLTEGIFEHIIYLYGEHIATCITSALFKKIFLCKLFALLGLHPDDIRSCSLFFEYLTSKSFDKLWCQPAIIADEKEVDRWLMMCVAIHVPTFRLKAMQLDKLIGVL